MRRSFISHIAAIFRYRYSILYSHVIRLLPTTALYSQTLFTRSFYQPADRPAPIKLYNDWKKRDFSHAGRNSFSISAHCYLRSIRTSLCARIHSVSVTYHTTRRPRSITAAPNLQNHASRSKHDLNFSNNRSYGFA